MPRLILFDVDGTIVDSQADIVAAMAAGFGSAGIPAPDRASTLSIVGLSLDHAVAALTPGIPADQQAVIVDGYRKHAVAAREAASVGPPLYDGMVPLLRRLAAEPETLLGTATGKARRGLDHMIDMHDLGGVFTTLQCADNHPSKPHPSMALTAMAETGVAAAATVMIGDTTFDMELGKAAGARAIGVTWGYHVPEALEQAGADVIVDTVAALATTLEAWR